MTIDLFKPSVPPLSGYQSYLELIDRNQMYSNFGPVYHLFKDRLADHFGGPPSFIELFSSGTMALVAALQTLKRENRPYCVLPSWTFVATAQAVVAAGLIPIFVDVDLETMQLTSDFIELIPPSILEQSSVALVVSPFGAPLNLDGFKELSERFGLEVLCDCAAGFESFKPNEFHNVISLHATKTFGIGEGGLLISSNLDVAERAKAYSNFGFMGSRKSSAIGVNGKLSEFHSAVGLGALDLWPSSHDIYYTKAGFYSKKISQICKPQNGWGKNWVSSTCVVQFASIEQKNKAQILLSSKNIQSRNWWNQGCHHESIFRGFKFINNLSNTDALAQTTLGIPFYRDITFEDMIQVSTCLEGVL
jgi:dTDP-4-amino-4,6-dideoxygalactose transaminase